MKRRTFIWVITLILICMTLSPVTAFGDNGSYYEERYMNIVTSDNRPLSIDRLLYTAFKDIGYKASFVPFGLRTGYEMANRGESDGVIASNPDMELTYPNLRKVPVELERNEIYAFVRTDSALEINDWSDLSGLRVGIMPLRVYIPSQIPADATVMTEDTSYALFDRLINGGCDVVVMEERLHELLNPPDDVMYSGKLSVLSEYLYLNEKYESLIPQITNSLNRVFSDGRGDKILSDEPIPEMNLPKTVLHIVSSSDEIGREDRFYANLKENFKDDSVEWYNTSLYSSRYPLDPSRQSSIAQLLRQDCVSKDVAAIVISGEDALKFISEYYLLFFRNVPVLFYGMDNGYQSAIREFDAPFAGIQETLSASETASLALRLFPGTKNIFVVNDYTAEGSAYKAAVEEQLEPFKNSVNIHYNQNVGREALMAQIRELPANSLVFIGSYFRDANGQYYTENELTRALEENCNVPVFTLYSMNAGYNSIGGKTPDYEIYSDAISGMLRHLLSGGDADEVQFIADSSDYNRWVFNESLMNKWNIKGKSLPEDALILNRTLPIWESNPTFVFTLIIIFILAIAIPAYMMVLFKYRKQQELLDKDAKIREVKERLERIISAAPILFLIAVDGKVVEINEALKKEIGLDVGDHTLHVYADPQERDAILGRAIKEGVLKNQVMKFKFLNGKIHRCLINFATADYNGKHAIVVWAMDIEESETKKDQLQTARRNLQTVMDTLPIPIRIVDSETTEIVYVNNKCVEMFEYESPESLCGLSVVSMLPPIQTDGTDSREKVMAVLNDTGVACNEIEYCTATGKIIEALLVNCTISYNDRISSVGIITDLTAEKEYQRMLLDTAEKEKEANLLKSRFLVHMSHEIRTPMNAIIGLTEIELRKAPSKDAAEIYKKINISAKNLLQIINDVLDLSKIEADKVELFIEEFELEEVVNSSLLVATPRLDGKNVEFLLNAALDLPRYVIGDRTRLWQVLKNFLDNSAKYTEEGKITLSISSDPDKSDAKTIYITFTIKDTGIGIGEDQMQKLFMPYGQIYNEAQKRYTGTGLGMVISKQLCELMGGEMQIESHVGKGTTIYITIPFKRSENIQTGLQAIKKSPLSGLNVLAVDDDAVSLSIMENLLVSTEVNCELASSGEEALKIIFNRRSKGESFDLILLDYMMDGLNGLETAKQIQTGLSKAPKLLMVTSYQRLLLQEDLEENGVDDIIEKPFIPTQFINKLCETLGCGGDSAEESRETFTQFKGVRVLLCEDYNLNQEVATGMFAQFGIETTIAENGSQGIDILNTGEPFDLIFMDLQMPVMDGYEATQIIRSDSRFDNIPIISLTADAMREVIDKCMEAGMDDYVSKPIEFSRLNNVFLKWLPESKRASVNSAVKPDVEIDGLARFGGKRDLYAKALREFAQLLPDEWPDLNYAVSHLEETKGIIHKIKGAAGNLSEMDIYRYSSEFETSLRNEIPDRSLYERLINASGVFKKKIADETQSVDSDTAAGTAEELKENLDNLKEALLNYDLKKSSKALDALKGKTWPDADDDKLRQLYGFMQQYDYVSALDVLESME